MKKNVTKEIIEKIYDYSLEDIMGERFGSYSKYIIQDRAIPDVRDGLKPVQRRILYSMFKEKNTFDRGYRKSAKTVGDVIGNYRPHGDSSIYDAMVRMSQDWKMRNIYVDMHGNNGSIDGDSPAAYRYTEARLSKISGELLKDIDKNTVLFAPNFDDTTLEPTVLPAKYPNLLVNGTTGISAGYATNIPPHNLDEVIDGTIKRIDSPNCRLETVMESIKGPDFPTGGIIEGIDGIKSAYENGKGKIILRSKTHFQEEKGMHALIITEIPYEVNKALLIRKIDEIRIDKKIEGITEVRDESDKDGLRISIDLRKDANKELVLNYLLKNTDLQVAYNFNMIAIVNRRPRLLGLLEILDAYISHQKEIIVKRTEFNLEHAKARLHIVEGLIKCLSILDEVIKVIRESENKSNAIENLVKEFAFTTIQADAIVTLQLYKLTNTDVTQLEEELNNLMIIIKGLEDILGNPETLKSVMKDELRKIKKEYSTPRLSEIKDEITEIKIDTTLTIPNEKTVVVVSKDGYVKRCSLRSYNPQEETLLKENDYLIGLYDTNTLSTLLLFTNLGNYLYVPVYTLPDLKWKEMGKHISNIIKLDNDEEIISSIIVNEFDSNKDITISTKLGMIKRTSLEEFKSVRYSKPITCMKLKDNDMVVNAFSSDYNNILITTNNGMGLWFDISEIPIVGLRTSGVKGINLKNDYVVSVHNFHDNSEYVTIFTDNKTAKRIKISEINKITRAKKGIMILREVKTNPFKVIKTLLIDTKNNIGIKTDEINIIKSSDIPITDRYSVGSNISKKDIVDVFIVCIIEKDNSNTPSINNDIKDEEIIEEEKEETKVRTLEEIDQQLRLFDI